MEKLFYVYCHRKKSTGECFYIGKGTGPRYKCKTSRNNHWYNIVNKYGFEAEILVNNISEEKAFELESHICNQIGYENLCNIREEDGWGGWSHSEETKLKMSKPKPLGFGDKVSKRLKGVPRSEEVKEKLRNPKTELHKLNLSVSLKGKTKGRIINWDVGRKKGQKSDYDYSKRIMDYSNVGAKNKKVGQYTLQGVLIKIWDSRKQISIVEGYNAVCIGNVCRGIQLSHKGYIWKYE